MIIRDEWDKFRLESPRPFYVPIYEPFFGGVSETQPARIVLDTKLTFTPEYDQSVPDPEARVKVWNVVWRWMCQDCYAASGDTRNVFKTDWVRREDLGERGDRNRGGPSSPSYDQQKQMSDHARQHGIIWAWVRSIDK